MRLAWWRDRLRDLSANWPKGEPLLTALKCWQDGHGALIALVDGWEALLGDAPLPVDAFETWIHGRVTACAALGKGGEEMARGWALSDLASHIGDAQEQLLLAELVEAHRWKERVCHVRCALWLSFTVWPHAPRGRAGRGKHFTFHPFATWHPRYLRYSPP
jgi:hypothetical protein